MTGPPRGEGASTRSTFAGFFRAATGCDPYPYQKYLSRGGIDDIPDVLNIPTGAGKTEAAVLAVWMWRRFGPDPLVRRKTPRRLVYCLPMRSLVEQTRERIQGFVKNLKLEGGGPGVVTLMGSDVDKEYARHPGREAVIVGTQDMLLSRSLNRGYVATPFMWPMEFAAMNNDCLWILDEVQLMGNGLATSAQLDAFRRSLGTFGPHRTLWMSATVDMGHLDTVDSKGAERTALSIERGGGNGGARLVRTTRRGGREVSEDVGPAVTGDGDGITERLNASKPLGVLDMNRGDKAYSAAEAKNLWKIATEEGRGSLALVIVNTVKRAQSLYSEFRKIADKNPGESPSLVLAHSRFRREDRNRIMEKIMPQDGPDIGLIIVSTQVIEAGMDVSAKVLITEAAPWSSLVQRFGRCNREGKMRDAKVHVITMKPGAHVPYDKEDLERALGMITENRGKSMSPMSVPADKGARSPSKVVLRRNDLLGLFDTSPDVSGGYTDVARYVRSADATSDVHVFWRRWDKKSGSLPPPYPGKGEVCPVPASDLQAFAKEGRDRRLYRYDHIDGRWEAVRPGDARPGQTLLIHADDGGYSEIGWDPSSKRAVEPVEAAKDTAGAEMLGESVADDPQSLSAKPVTLCDHTAHVTRHLEDLQKGMDYDGWPHGTMREATILHDLGKAHDVFQRAMRSDGEDCEDVLLAKSGGSVRVRYTHPNSNRRLFFRHEAISAAAILNNAGGDLSASTLLKAYVVAAHHGKVRMSMRNPPAKVRSGRYYPHDPRYIAGVPVCEEQSMPNFISDRHSGSCAEGRPKIDGWNDDTLQVRSEIGIVGARRGSDPSWIAIAQGLLKGHGPFRLALLESALRAADMAASAEERTGGGGT